MPFIVIFQDLSTFLENDSEDEKEIWSSYRKNNNNLSLKARKNLVHLLIRREKTEVLKDLKPGEVLQSWEYV